MDMPVKNKEVSGTNIGWNRFFLLSVKQHSVFCFQNILVNCRRFAFSTKTEHPFKWINSPSIVNTKRNAFIKHLPHSPSPWLRASPAPSPPSVTRKSNSAKASSVSASAIASSMPAIDSLTTSACVRTTNRVAWSRDNGFFFSFDSTFRFVKLQFWSRSPHLGNFGCFCSSVF